MRCTPKLGADYHQNMTIKIYTIMKKQIFVFLFNGYADWEIAYLAPEINKSEVYDLVYFTKDGNPVTSMGGLQVLPNTSLSKINIDDIHLLILPGGNAWEKNENSEIDSLAKALFAQKKPIAAICAATTYLGKLGFLDNLNHTSNDINYLKAIAPQYQGENHYINAYAVNGDNIITANGIATIEFAKEVFLKLELHSEEDIEKWFQLFKNGVWSE